MLDEELIEEEDLIEEEEEPPDSRAVAFPCDNCGADMRWDPASDAMACDHCGARVEVPRGEDTILERSLDDAAGADRGYGVELRVTRCDNCGARVTFDGSATAEACVFCGSSQVLAQEANRNALRPESLVPLDVARGTVEENFRTWLRKLWFRPSALKNTKRFEAAGVYVPFWTFDALVDSDWSADAGYYYYVNRSYWTTHNGKRVRRTRRERKVRWVPRWGSRRDGFDDLLVNGASGQPEALVAKLGEFDTRGLVPYRPEYLAGWRAEEYSVDLEGAWRQAESAIEAAQRRRCSGDVPGDTQRDLRVRNMIRDVRWKHVLLPIWSLQYRFGGKLYTVLVHGQTGRVVGRAPWSWVKIALLVLGILAVVGIVALIVAGGGLFLAL